MKTAALCAKNYAEFAGIQQGIKSFLSQRRVDPHEAPLPASACVTTAITTTKRSSSSKFFPAVRRNNSKQGAPSKPNQQSIKAFFGQSSNAVSRKAPSSSESSRSSMVQPIAVSKPAAKTNARNGEDEDIETVLREFETKHKAAEGRLLEWKQVLSGQPPKTPLCYCQQPTVLRTVLKTNDNWGRKFYVCTKPAVRSVVGRP